jgi:hydrogenase nickel incorporation protein HypB
MCDSCGCNITPAHAENTQAITVLSHLLAENDHTAQHNREHFDHYQVLAINLMSSPGAGKTALLEATLQQLASEFNMAVIEGDLETENDAMRIRQLGVEAVQITTGTACHLDAHMIHHALHGLALEPLDIVFIENVGNLVCPACFDLGQDLNVILLSVPEGDDKPAKYPVMFRTADLVVISKSDLLPILDDFSLDKAQAYLHDIACGAPIMTLSAKRQLGLEPWLAWLRQHVKAKQTVTA